MVMARRRFLDPETEPAAMFVGFACWWVHLRDCSKGSYFFAGSAEGFGIADVLDEAAFHRMMIGWPFAYYLDLDTRSDLGAEEALGFWFDETRLVAAGR